jgi:coenzyme F420-0:L-glutamate ligase/coenzyme F420-1:gamma-L-glutamate ligase
MSPRLEILAIEGIGEVRPGDDLVSLIVQAQPDLQDGDVLVVTQKVVSKAEAQLVPIDPGDPDSKAKIVEGESVRVLRRRGDLVVSETRHGFVCANAGIDSSNLPQEGTACLLPEDPDASARRIRGEIRSTAGVAPAVIISDSFGRAWRLGQSEVAIGCAGLSPLDDWRGRRDAHGRELEATLIAVGDEAAAAADLARGKASGIPVVLVRGLDRFITLDDGPGAAALRRPPEEDLFR